MTKMNLLKVLEGPWGDGTRPKDVFQKYVSKAPSDYLQDIILGMQSEKRKAQSGCAIVASLVSESHPELLYPHIGIFEKNLKASEPVLRWEAVCTLGNLARVDTEGRVLRHIDTVSSLLTHESIVLQGHSVRALSKIALVFPDHAPQILRSLIGSRDAFPGNKCGFLVEAMESFARYPSLLPTARAFVEEHTQSTEKSVATKARRVLKKL